MTTCWFTFKTDMFVVLYNTGSFLFFRKQVISFSHVKHPVTLFIHLTWKQRNSKGLHTEFTLVSHFPSFPPSVCFHLIIYSVTSLSSAPSSFSFILCMMSLTQSWWFCVSRGKSAPRQTASWRGQPTSLWGNSCKSECDTSGPLCWTSEGWSEKENSQTWHRLSEQTRRTMFLLEEKKNLHLHQ